MAEPTLQQKLRAAYGRGAHDARKAMENDPMTPAKLAQAEQSVNGIALKVLEATPKQEPWPLNKIIGELKRQGCSIGPDVALGCLSTMAKTGLVREPEPRCFIRVTAKERTVDLAVVPSKPVRQAKPAPEPTAEPEAAPAAEPTAERDTLAKLADLAAGVRVMAQQFTDLARAIDDVAIEVEERIARSNDDSTKLAQLRALLKGIGA